MCVGKILQMKILTPLYKVFRSIVIFLIMLVVVIYAGLYILLSIPAVQEKVKGVACVEASKLLGGRIDIGRLDIRPFSEVSLSDVSLTSPEGERCATIENVSAGIESYSTMPR